ncbi:MAG TPA: MFS transporter [Streptosporangiaceae bacterium]|jgi:MFS family permease|nr:MFS transporter [Streptosporangiaceae bacterium]
MTSSSTGRTRLARRLTNTFSDGPLAVRDFRLFGLGQLGSTVGDFCYAVALPWLVLSAHGGTVLLGTVLACYGVPRTVLIPIGGVLADRFSPRTVMLAADVVRCVLVAILTVFAARSLVSVAFLGPVAALIGAGEGLFLPASAAIMPSLLPADQLQAGNGLSSAMIQIGSLTGPVLGGILVTTAGPTPAFAVDAASFAVSAASLALMRGTRAPQQTGVAQESPPEAEAPEPATIAAATATDREAVAGAAAAAPPPEQELGIWRFFLGARVLQAIVIISVLANFVIAGAFEVALPALAHARFGAAGYGALIACFGLGALGGTLTAAKLSGLRRPAMGACAGFVIGGIAIAFVPFLGGLPGAAAAALVFGAAGYFGNVVVVTLLQQWAPPQLLGRVMSLVMLASIGAFPASVALSGVIVRHIGPAPFFPAAGAILVLAVLLAATIREFRDFGLTATLATDQAAVVAAK